MKDNGKSADEFYHKLFYYLSFIALVFLMLSLLALLSPSSTNAAINQWSAINTGLTDLDVRSVAVSPTFSSDTTLFVGTNGGGVFKSTDGGNNWSAINTGLTNLNLRSVAVSPTFSSDGTLFAGTFGGGIFKSTDGGNNWSAINTGLTDLDVLSVAISPTFSSDGTLFAGTSGGGVFKTTNGGVNWSAINTGLTNLDVRSVAVSPTFSSDGTLFAGTFGGGIFKSTDGGNNWSAINTGLTNLFVRSVAVSPTFSSDQTLFAGTNGGGVYKFTLTPTHFTSSKEWTSGSGFGIPDSSKVISGDFDGDGYNDVAVFCGYSSNRQAMLWVHLSSRTAFDAPVIWWNSGPNNWDADGSKITVGDYNNDNMDDVGILYGYQSTRQSKAWIFTSSGTAFNSPTVWWDSVPNNWDWDGSKLTSGDYDNDGASDFGILYGYKTTRQSKAWIFTSNGATAFNSPTVWWDSGPNNWDAGGSKLTSGDYDNDGASDFGVLYGYRSTRQSKAWIFTSNGATAFNSPTVWWDSGPNNWDWGGSKLTTGDYNGDGRSDFGIFYGYPTVTKTIAWVLVSSGTAFKSPASWWDSGPGNWAWSASKITSGDYNGNGSSDLASLYYYSGAFLSLFKFSSI